jgi:hypothetical protein
MYISSIRKTQAFQTEYYVDQLLKTSAFFTQRSKSRQKTLGSISLFHQVKLCEPSDCRKATPV